MAKDKGYYTIKIPRFKITRAEPKKVVEKMSGAMMLEAKQSPGIYQSSAKAEYENFIDAFKQLPWLYAGATALAIAAPKPTLRLMQRTKDEAVEITESGALDVIRRPHPFLSQRELTQITVINLLITGSAYWNLVGSVEDGEISRSNLPVEIYWIKPEQMDIKSDEKEFISHYVFTSSSGKAIPISASEIIHHKLPNPDSYFEGLGVLEPLKNTAILEFFSVAYNKSFMENDATPPWYFSSEEKLSPEQMERHRRIWNETHSGSGKRGKHAYVFGGMEIKTLGGQPKDAEYIEQRKLNREEMLACLGVPPSVVGLLEYANYSNMEVQQKKFWEDSVMPLLDVIADNLTLRLAPLFHDDAYFIYDYSNIKALQEDEKEKSEMVTALVSNGIITRNEARARYYNLEPREGLDLIYLPLNLQPIEGSEKEIKVAKALKKKEEKPSFWATPTRKKILWDDFVMRVESKEKPFEKKAYEYLIEQAERVSDKAKRAGKISEMKIGHIFDEEKEIRKYVNIFKARYLDIFTEAGEAGIDISSGKLYNPTMRSILKEEAGFVLTPEMKAKIDMLVLECGAQVNRATLEKLLLYYGKASTEKWSTEEFAQFLKSKFTEISVGRARTIVRTEVARLENYGQLEGYKQSEFVDMKGWLCSFVEDSRESHMAADAEYSAAPIPLNDPFIVDGEELQYPGDTTSASPGNTINCLCSTFPEVREI